MKTLEEDAKERGERRKERESKGREHKRRGNGLFRAGQYDNAVDAFSMALYYTPWDVSLYTNRALVICAILDLPPLHQNCCRHTIDWVSIVMQLQTVIKR